MTRLVLLSRPLEFEKVKRNLSCHLLPAESLNIFNKGSIK
jgi:hypothetical protein